MLAIAKARGFHKSSRDPDDQIMVRIDLGGPRGGNVQRSFLELREARRLIASLEQATSLVYWADHGIEFKREGEEHYCKNFTHEKWWGPFDSGESMLDCLRGAFGKEDWGKI
jgi:hypothetical protein